MGFLAQNLISRKVKSKQVQLTFNILKAQSYLYFFLLEEGRKSFIY